MSTFVKIKTILLQNILKKIFLNNFESYTYLKICIRGLQSSKVTFGPKNGGIWFDEL